MKNILIIANSDFPASSAVHVHHFANCLVSNGFDCVVAVPQDKSSVAKMPGSLYKVIEHQEVDRASAYFTNQLPPDILHGWTPREHIRNAIVKLAQQCDCLWFIHLEDNEEAILTRTLQIPPDQLHTLPEESFPHNLSHPRRYRELLALVDGITIIIDKLKEFVPQNTPSLLLYPGVDTTEFYPRPPKPQLLQHLNIPNHATIICYTGTVYPSNREEVRSLFLAIGKRNQAGKPTVLVRTGANGCEILNPEDKWVEQYIIDLGWVERQQIPDILALADILIQPGKADEFNNYRFPSKIPEFMAMGKPVILPQTNIALSLTHLQDAFILPVVDEYYLQEAIDTIAENYQLSEQLSQGALKYAQNNFSWAKSTEKLIKFYHSIDKNNYQLKWQKQKYINQLMKLELTDYQQKNNALQERIDLSHQEKLRYKDKMQELEEEIKQLREEIITMKSSKFWKMRRKWFKLKQIFKVN